MSYVKSVLLPQEELIYQAKPHWVMFWPAIVWTLLAPFFLLQQGPITWIGYVILLIAVLHWFSTWIKYDSTEFSLTNRRVILKIGFIRRFTTEMLLQRIEAIKVQQGLFGRILDFGTIVIIGTGGSRDPFSQVAAPIVFQQRVQEQIERVLNKESRT